MKDGIISEAAIVHFMNHLWCLSIGNGVGNWEEWCFSRSETKFGIRSSRTFELSKLVIKCKNKDLKIKIADFFYIYERLLDLISNNTSIILFELVMV